MDETDFLTLFPANEKHLLENIAAEPSKTFIGDELKEYNTLIGCQNKSHAA